MSSREALARLLWSEIAGSDQRQCDVAATVGITEKHLSQVINGKAGMQLDMVDQVLAAVRPASGPRHGGDHG
jgi:plasmid maintenance system antidote protein VapI